MDKDIKNKNKFDNNEKRHNDGCDAKNDCGCDCKNNDKRDDRKNSCRKEDATSKTVENENVNVSEEDNKQKTVSSEEFEAVVSECEKYKKQAEENKQSWYRTAADFDNYKKRNAESRANAYSEGKGDVIKSILSIGDNLERALTSAADDKTKEGLNLVIRSFSETLKNLGVEEINPVGQPFDPNLHEAVMQAECGENEQPGTVKTVFRKGYSLNAKMLRYAQVAVIKEN